MNQTIEPIPIKPAIDKPASKKLEDFLTHICWKLQENPDRPRTTLGDFVTAFRKYFKLGLPLAPQIEKLLRELNFGLQTREKANGLDGSFDYDPVKERWVVYIPSDLGLKEPMVILHEVFEIVCWRCYHRIPWWPAWAAVEKLDNPHKKADEFAMLVVLPEQKFRNQLKKFGFDLWELSAFCQATPSACFNAIQRYVMFPFPYFHALLGIDTQPNQMQMVFEADKTLATVHKKIYKRPKEEDCGIDWEKLSPAQFADWNAVAMLQQFPSKGSGIEICRNEPIYKAKQTGEMQFATTDYAAGVSFPVPVDVIARPKPKQQSLLHLQIVPAGCGRRLFEGDLVSNVVLPTLI